MTANWIRPAVDTLRELRHGQVLDQLAFRDMVATIAKATDGCIFFGSAERHIFGSAERYSP